VVETLNEGFDHLRREKILGPIPRKATQGSGVLQIGIKAWLHNLSYLGSWMSCVKTIFK
jgi:hypothetical protein